MPSKSVLERGFKTLAEKISEDLRKELRIAKFDPLDAFKLAAHLNAPVFSVSEVFADEPTSPQAILLNNPDLFSAMWMPNAEGIKLIIHNSNHSKFRQQSNIMHELSHIIRKHEIPDETARLCLKFNLHYYNPIHEQEAKYLGGCLQITRAGLLWALKQGMSHTEISEYYCASHEMVKYRLGITGAERQRAFQLSKGRGFR
jgi:Zn-dependent peptidase ImmA (M78 family)